MPSPAEVLASRRPPKKGRTRRKGYERHYLLIPCTIRERRMALGLPLREVADAVGMSLAGLHQIEGGCNLTLTSAQKLARFYGASIDELWPSAGQGKEK